MRRRSDTFRPALVTGVSGTLLFLLVGCVPPPPDPAPPIIDHFATTATGFTDPALVPFTWTVHDPNGDTLTCRLDGDGDGTWDTTISPCPATGGATATAGVGAHTATLQVSDAIFPAVTATESYTVGVGPTEPYNIDIQYVGATDSRVVDAVGRAVTKWSAVIARGVPDAEVHFAQGNCFGDLVPSYDGTVDDIVVDVTVMPLPGFMGDASWCVVGSDGLPRLSMVRISTIGLDNLYTTGALDDLVSHEFGHALGFGTVAPWATFTENTGEVTGYQFSGPRSVAEFLQLGGRGAAVPLSHDAGHWDETTLQNELMTCYLEAGTTTHPLSGVTAAAMADLGYHVDMSAVDSWTVPPSPGYSSC